jgi:hypothetical protein
MTLMQILHLKKKNPMCVLWTPCEYCTLNTFSPILFLWPHAGITISIPLIQFCFYDPNVSITIVVFISMANKHQKYGYYIFCIDGFLCLWKYCEIILLHMYWKISRLKYCITKHGYKKLFSIGLVKK